MLGFLNKLLSRRDRLGPTTVRLTVLYTESETRQTVCKSTLWVLIQVKRLVCFNYNPRLFNPVTPFANASPISELLTICKKYLEHKREISGTVIRHLR